MLKRLTRQGNHIVARDEEGRIIKATPSADNVVRTTEHRTLVPGEPKKTIRKKLRELTNEGADLYINLINLAKGNPIERRDNEGRVNVTLPTPEVMLQATKTAIELIDGKAVAATELIRAEKEATDLARYESMSDDDLERAIDGLVTKRRELEPTNVAPESENEP